jgi:hypothetical protein
LKIEIIGRRRCPRLSIMMTKASPSKRSVTANEANLAPPPMKRQHSTEIYPAWEAFEQAPINRDAVQDQVFAEGMPCTATPPRSGGEDDPVSWIIPRRLTQRERRSYNNNQKSAYEPGFVGGMLCIVTPPRSGGEGDAVSWRTPRRLTAPVAQRSCPPGMD